MSAEIIVAIIVFVMELKNAIKTILELKTFQADILSNLRKKNKKR